MVNRYIILLVYASLSSEFGSRNRLLHVEPGANPQGDRPFSINPLVKHSIYYELFDVPKVKISICCQIYGIYLYKIRHGYFPQRFQAYPGRILDQF
jgi:hypothetical protein